MIFLVNIRKLIVDACILIAKFRGEDPAFQMQHTESFLDIIKDNNFKIIIIEKVFKETDKYPSLKSSIDEWKTDLESKGKLELIKTKEFKNKHDEVVNIMNEAENEEINLSFQDALQAQYASETKIPLITWDSGLIDYCILKNIDAFRPNEFIEYFERADSTVEK